MGLPGGDDIGGLSGDDGTVGVGDQAVVDVGVGHGSHRVDSTSSSSMGSPGSNLGRRLIVAESFSIPIRHA